MVAIDDATLAINRQHPVGIAVKSEAHGSSTIQHSTSQGLEMGGAAPHIDPLPIGFTMEHRDIGTELGEHHGPAGCGRAPAEIQNNRHTIQPLMAHAAEKILFVEIEKFRTLA